MRFLVVPFVLAGATACAGQPTAPSRALITTIQYQRIYPVTGADSGGRMLINVSRPAHKDIPFCFPVPQTGTTFVCNDLNWEISAGEEAVIWVDDPALNRGVATTLLVNGMRISRIETQSNGNELGRFHLSTTGRFE